MKRLSIKKCKKLATQLCGESPNFKKGDFWFYFPDEELIQISNDKTLKEDEKAIILQYFRDFTNTRFSLFTYSLLHELGHYNSCNIEDSTGKIQDNLDYYTIVTKALTGGLISFKDAITLYYNEDSELDANDFVEIMTDEFYDLIYNFDNNL